MGSYEQYFMHESPRGPRDIVDNTIREVDELLDLGIQSRSERDMVLRKLYTARAIYNDPKIIELIESVEVLYGKTGSE
jgi:hypothetical protein